MMTTSESKMFNFFSRVYLWMFVGLLVSGITAYFTATTPEILKYIYMNFRMIIIIELLLVISFSLLRSKVSFKTAKILFIIYSIISGLTLSSVFIAFKLDSIVQAFLASAVMFGLLAAYGYKTKQDLTSFGKMLFIGLISIIICSIINIFINGSTFGILITVVSVIIFLGLTAWDMQNLKRIYNHYCNDEEQLNKASIYGALDLYLDFVNIFLKLLNLFGNSKD